MTVWSPCEWFGSAFDSDGAFVLISVLTAGAISGGICAVDTAACCRFGRHGSWIGAWVGVFVVS